jgi:hypothetical protein
VNNFFFQNQLRRFNLYYYDGLTGTPPRGFVDVQLVEAQLPDSDSTTGNKKSDNNKMPVFTNVDYADTHLFLVFAMEIVLLPWRLPYGRVIERVHRNARETGSHDVCTCWSGKT